VLVPSQCDVSQANDSRQPRVINTQHWRKDLGLNTKPCYAKGLHRPCCIQGAAPNGRGSPARLLAPTFDLQLPCGTPASASKRRQEDNQQVPATFACHMIWQQACHFLLHEETWGAIGWGSCNPQALVSAAHTGSQQKCCQFCQV